MLQFDFKECQNPECLKIFKPNVYNAIYCSTECRKIVTNKRLLEKYYENKQNKNLKKICKTPKCTTVLSRYNKEDICDVCKQERFIKRLVSWGYDENKLRKEI